MVSAPDCGSGGQGFESLYPPCLHGETLGYRQAVRHSTLTAAFAGSNPASPVKRELFYGALAQSVEHLTFNQVVRGSNPRCFIAEKRRKPCIYAGLRRFCVMENELFELFETEVNVSFRCHRRADMSFSCQKIVM